MALFSCVLGFILCCSCLSWGQEIPSLSPMLGGYPPVDVNELDPMTLNWNQVHYLVREMLIEADDLKREHDRLYKELQSCYGLEDCLRGFDLLNKNIDSGMIYAEDTLLSSLQRGREAVTSNFGNRGESERREYQRVQDYQRNQQGRGSSASTTNINDSNNYRGYNQNSFGRNVTYSYSNQRGSNSATGTNQYNGEVRNSQFPTRPRQLGGGELGTAGGERGRWANNNIVDDDNSYRTSGSAINNNDNGGSTYGRSYQYSYEYTNNYGNQDSRGYDRDIPDNRRGR